MRCGAIIVLLAVVLTAEDRTRQMDAWPGGGMFAQVVDSSEWKTTFHLTNVDTKPIYVGLVFFNDQGDTLRLPIAGGTAGSVGVTLEPNRSFIVSTDGVGALKQGWAGVMTCDSRCSDATSKVIRAKLLASAIVRQSVPGRQDSEAVVPIDLPDQPVALLYDNRAGYSTGVALLNPAPAAATLSVRVMDSQGVVVGEESMTLPAGQKRVFVVSDRFAQSAGRFGHIVVSGSSVVAMGLRFNPNGSFTSSHAMTMVPMQ